MKKSTRYSPEVMERAVRMVEEAGSQYESQWEAITSIAGKIGCTAEAVGAPQAVAQVTVQPAKPLPSWAPEPDCMKEFERTTQHSPKCAEQRDYAVKRMREEMKKCTDAMQKIYDLCGIGKDMNEACYKKHRPYLEANCEGP